MIESLEFRTLLIAFALIRVLQAMGLLYVWRIHRKYLPARNWAAGSSLIAIGALFAALRGQLPFDWAIIAGNFFLFAGIAIFDAGIVQACNGKVPWRIGSALVVAATASHAWLTVWAPSMPARIVLLSCITIICDGYAAVCSLRAPRGPLHRTQLLIAVLLILECAASINRSAAALNGDYSSVLHSTAAQNLFIVTLSGTTFLMSLALTVLTGQRITALFEAILSNMNHAVAMFDEQRKLIIWNKQYQDVYRLSSSQLKSMSDQDATRDRPSPHSGVRGEDDVGGVIGPATDIERLNDGRLIAVSRQSMDGGGWVTTHEDVTEREGAQSKLAQYADELANANLRFDAAINNLSQGFALFDADRRIVFCNDRFSTMYGLSPEQIKPGTLLAEIYQLRLRSGIFAGPAPERYLPDRVKSLHEASVRIDDLNDGRAIRIVHQPMPGGGWVTTHEDITERRHAEAKIAFMAHHDLLTGLANRAYFLEVLGAAAARLRQSGEEFAIFMLDLDRFKSVNDSFGHPAGDILLKETARRLHETLAETDTLARFGGDEFAIIQAHLGNSRESCIALANKIVDVIDEPYRIEGSSVNIGVSIGIVTAPRDGSDETELMKKADLALYTAKSNGRHGYRFFDAEVEASLNTRQQLERELRTALSQQELELYYQPIIDLRTRMPIAAEALIRWHHPHDGLISADHFMPLAEETGLIVPLRGWALNKACADAAKWPPHIKVAVNLSSAQFASCNLLDVVLCALVESDLPPGRLELDIPEAVLLANEADHVAVLHQLKNIGISISLDNFGTGYSSLRCFTKFAFDRIKVDRSVTDQLMTSREGAAMLSAVVAMGRGLEATVVASGIEQHNQLELLRAAGVNLGQGYLFGRPCPPSEIQFSRFDENKERSSDHSACADSSVRVAVS